MPPRLPRRRHRRARGPPDATRPGTDPALASSAPWRRARDRRSHRAPRQRAQRARASVRRSPGGKAVRPARHPAAAIAWPPGSLVRLTLLYIARPELVHPVIRLWLLFSADSALIVDRFG